MTDYGITYDGTSYLSNYGRFASGPNIIVIHSLECDAHNHIAEELSARGGWLDNEGLSPQRMTDPCSIVKTIPDGTQGGHIGSPGNSHCAGVEVSGRAAWTRSQWMDGGSAQAALDHQARAVAGLAIVYGWGYDDLRWLSIAQVKAGARGLCTHNDISISGISRTDHWDPGTGYPFDWVLGRIRYWYQVMTGGSTVGLPVGSAIIDDEDGWLDMGAKEEILDALKNRKEGSQSVFDELRYTVQNNIIPAVRAAQAAADNAAKQVASLRAVLFQAGYDVGGHSVREEVGYAMDHPAPGGSLSLIVDDSTGAWYAAGPGVLMHLTNWPAVNAGQKAGTLDKIAQHVTAEEMAAVRTQLGGGVEELYVKPATCTVAAGDTLDKIATRFGVTTAQLQGWNAITDPNKLTVGQVLKVTG